jgi:hypothetical protein
VREYLCRECMSLHVLHSYVDWREYGIGVGRAVERNPLSDPALRMCL